VGQEPVFKVLSKMVVAAKEGMAQLALVPMALATRFGVALHFFFPVFPLLKQSLNFEF